MISRIAVVGIDGSGKSTVIRRFLELGPLAKAEVAVTTCPGYHRTPDLPLADLSRALEVLGEVADALGSFELKAAALHLQMTLFGPIEAFVTETFAPRVLVSERHALVDGLAYGPFYARMVRTGIDRGRFEQAIESEFARRMPGAFARILDWHELERRRLGSNVSFWDLPLDVREVLVRPFPERAAELSRRYRTRWPDVVILLDVPADRAYERVAARGGSSAATELHETAAFLAELGKSYRAVLDAIAEALSSVVQIHVVDTSASVGVDATLAEVLDRAGLARRL